MKTLQIVVEGVSEEQIQKDIERMTRGWRLFFEPINSSYDFINSFWGDPWDETSESLRNSILSHIVIDNVKRHFYLRFVLDGRDRFYYSSNKRAIYDCITEMFHNVPEGKMSVSITNLIKGLL